MVAVTSVANGVAFGTTATTVAAGAFVGGASALAMGTYAAAVESNSVEEFAEQGEAVMYATVGGSLTGAATAYKMANAQNVSDCFVARTLICTEDGEIPIEDIHTGDLVWAWDEDTGEVSLKPVVETYINQTDELVHVFVNGEEIVTTPTHPFYVPKVGWTSATHLRAGDILVLVSGEYVVVEQIQHEILEAPVTIYNFQVQDAHTYYVSESGVLVHNECKNKPTSQNQMQKQVEAGQAPSEVDRVDKPHVPGQQPHIHFKDGTAINMDGSKHDSHKGLPNITATIAEWILKNGWRIKEK